MADRQWKGGESKPQKLTCLILMHDHPKALDIGAQELQHQHPGLDRVHGELRVRDALDADAGALAALPLDLGRRGARREGHRVLREALVLARLGAPLSTLAVEGADDASEAVPIPDLSTVLQSWSGSAKRQSRAKRGALAPRRARGGAVGEREAAGRRVERRICPHHRERAVERREVRGGRR